MTIFLFLLFLSTETKLRHASHVDNTQEYIEVQTIKNVYHWKTRVKNENVYEKVKDKWKRMKELRLLKRICQISLN